MIHSAMTPGVAAASWPFVESFIKRAALHSDGDFNEKFIEQELQLGRMQLWTSFDKDRGLIACVVTSLQQYQLQKICFVHCLAGELEAIYKMEPSIINWMKANDAVAFESWGRKGFTKILPPGWKEVSRCYRKYIGN